MNTQNMNSQNIQPSQNTPFNLYPVLGVIAGFGFALDALGILDIKMGNLILLCMMFPVVYFLQGARQHFRKQRVHQGLQNLLLMAGILLMALTVFGGLHGLWAFMPLLGLGYAVLHIFKRS